MESTDQQLERGFLVPALEFLLDRLWLLEKKNTASLVGKCHLNYISMCVYTNVCIVCNFNQMDNIMILYDIFRHLYCCFTLSLSLPPYFFPFLTSNHLSQR